jgi:NADH-quinone oxidoreductase subunit K
VLAAALAGIGVYGLLARRNAVMVLVGAELLLNAAGVLLVTANALPAGGLAGLETTGGSDVVDPLLGGHSMTIFLVTIAAAALGLALAVVLLLFRARATSDLSAVRELGEASPMYTETPGAGEWVSP